MSLTPVQRPLSSTLKGPWVAVVVIVVIVCRVPAELVGTVLPVLAGVVTPLLGLRHWEGKGDRRKAVTRA